MIRKSPSVMQTACAVVRRDMRAGLVEATRWAGSGGAGSGGAGSGGAGSGGAGSVLVLVRVTAAVYALLAEHAVDRRGRCQRCRRPGSRWGLARRRCRVYPLLLDWLQQPHRTLAARLRRDLGLPIPPRTDSRTPVPRPGLTIIARAHRPAAVPGADVLSPVVSPAWRPTGEAPTEGVMPCPR